MIVGIDEVGRGAWAGPLCVGAVTLGDIEIEGLTDSKKLSPKKREKLDKEIRQKAAGVGLGWVSAKKIDEIGLSAALKLAARRALTQINIEYSQIIIDGTIMLVDDPKAVTMKRADLLVASVSAASIVAKVARDEYMKVLGLKFPGYGFEGHVGYGTAAHMSALEKRGPSPVHRMSFVPLREDVSGAKKVMSVNAPTAIGNSAEDATAAFLISRGFRIIDRNWKTKWCEIDIIASKKGVIHFIEVKYRKTTFAGGGLSAITPKKLRKMKFAAELWLSRRENQHVQQAVLSAAELSGDEFAITEFIEVI